MEKPWSSLAALRSSVRKPSGYIKSAFRSENRVKQCTNLDAVLEAVQLQYLHVSMCPLRLPYSRIFPSHLVPLQALSDSRLTSQQLFAIWQPAWPTIRVRSQHKFHVSHPGGQGGQGALGAGGHRGKGKHTVERDNLTHIGDVYVVGGWVDAEEMSRRTRWAVFGW